MAESRRDQRIALLEARATKQRRVLRATEEALDDLYRKRLVEHTGIDVGDAVIAANGWRFRVTFVSPARDPATTYLLYRGRRIRTDGTLGLRDEQIWRAVKKLEEGDIGKKSV